MPLYEFWCNKCKRKFTVLCSISERNSEKSCPKCNEVTGKRLVSRVKTVRSEEEMLEKLADPSALAGLEDGDPREVAGWAKKMAREMGENMDDEIDAMAEEEINSPEPMMDDDF